MDKDIKVIPAPFPKPNNAAVYHLSVNTLFGKRFIGWKMVFYKQIDTGKKDKNGKPVIKTVQDNRQPIVYDDDTQLAMAIKQNSQALSGLLLNNAKQSMQNKSQSSINSQLMLKLANQLIQNKQQAKINSQLMMQIAKLQIKGDK